MSKAVIRVSRLGKKYRYGGPKARYNTFRESFTSAVLAPLRKLCSGRRADHEQRELWALKDVSFQVEPGEVLGVIGRNGAGKSTLLKVLSRITEPTEGEVDLLGRVGSLLEVGTGFHPELTGRENIYLNGAILGMKRVEISRKFDEIASFAQVEQYIDTPVKHYSSGMYLRLAFAVAAHLETEILFVDEVLAVGDVEFQRRCLGKMGEVSRQGRTVLFVSHNMQTVATLCNRLLCLDRGRVLYDGTVAEGINCYYALLGPKEGEAGTEGQRSGSGEARFSSIKVERECYLPDEEKVIRFTLQCRAAQVPCVYLGTLVRDESGRVVAHCDSRLVGLEARMPGEVRGRFVLKLPWLKPGDYYVDFFACAVGMGILDHYERACRLRILPILPYPNAATAEAIASAPILADFAWEIDHAG